MPRYRNFYPRSPCGERLLMWYQCNTVVKISIHALLAESDAVNAMLGSSTMIFLSTLSLRRATANEALQKVKEVISIHALLAESDHHGNGLQKQVFAISIHALLAESDGTSYSRKKPLRIFLSTLSLRRATRKSPHCPPGHRFLSTLSLRRATQWRTLASGM